MRVLLLVAALGVCSSAACAQLPSQVLPLSGLLRDAGGAPLQGSFDFHFRVYRDMVGGVSIWDEQHAAVSVDVDGRYHVLLGSSAPLSPALFGDADRWVGVEVNGDGEMSPRLPLGPAPYAHNAALLDGSPAQTFAPRSDLDDQNPATSPVHWIDLIAVPAGFADGVDQDTTYSVGPGLRQMATTLSVDFAGTGIAGTVARSDHDHDTLYSTLSELSDLDPMTAPVDWSGLVNVPAGMADGVDDVNDADSDPANELIASVGLVGTSLTVTDAGGPSSADLSPLREGTMNFAAATGGGGNYEVALSPSIPAVPAGMTITFKANHPNPGAATLDVNGLGAVAIKKSVALDLTAGDIQSGQMVVVIFDGVIFQLLSPVSAPAPSPGLTAENSEAAGPWSSSVTSNWEDISILSHTVATGGRYLIYASYEGIDGGAGTYQSQRINADGLLSEPNTIGPNFPGFETRFLTMLADLDPGDIVKLQNQNGWPTYICTVRNIKLTLIRVQ